MAINNSFPLKAARKLKFSWGFESELQTNPMPFYLDSLWGTTLIPFRACAMDWGRNRIVRMGKSSGPILGRLWTRVREIWGRCKGALVRLCPIVYVMFRSEGIRREVFKSSKNRTNL